MVNLWDQKVKNREVTQKPTVNNNVLSVKPIINMHSRLVIFVYFIYYDPEIFKMKKKKPNMVINDCR